MPTWLYALIVLAFGLVLALFIDRIGRNADQLPLMCGERRKWMYIWFAGRPPTEEEMREEDRIANRESWRNRSGK